MKGKKGRKESVDYLIRNWKIIVFIIALLIFLNAQGCMCGSDTDSKGDDKESAEDQLNNGVQALSQLSSTLCGNTGLSSTSLCPGGGEGTGTEGVTDLCENCPDGDAGQQCRNVCNDVLAPTLKGTKLDAGSKFVYTYEFTMNVNKDTVYYVYFKGASGKHDLCNGQKKTGEMAHCAESSMEIKEDYNEVCVDFWQGQEQKSKCEALTASSIPRVDGSGGTVSGGQVTGPGEYSIKQGEHFSMKIPVTDADCSGAGCFTFTYTSTPPLSSSFVLDQMAGTIDFTPTQQDVGRHTLTVTVADKEGNKNTITITLTVVDVNDAPVLKMNDITIPEDGAVTIDLSKYVTDPDGNVSFKFNVKTQGNSSNIKAELTGSSLKLSATKNWNGQEQITVEASDGQLTSTASVNVIVSSQPDAPWIDPPIPTVMASEDFAPITIDLKQYGKDDSDTPDKLVWSIKGTTGMTVPTPNDTGEVFYEEPIIPETTSDSASIITATVTGNILKIESIKDKNGEAKIELILTDSGGLVTNYVLPVKIKGVNDVPVISDISDITVSGDEVYSLDMNSIVLDIDTPIKDLRFSFRYTAPEIRVDYDPTTQIAKFKRNPGYDEGTKLIQIIVTDFAGTSAKWTNIVWTKGTSTETTTTTTLATTTTTQETTTTTTLSE